MITQKVNVKEIIPNKSNPRIIKDDKFKKLVQSIKDFPQMLEIRPIVVDENNIILGGNMRFKACIEAGLKEVFIIKANDLTEEQKHEFIVKDNVGFGEWDWDILANEWDTEKLQDWGLDLPLDVSVQELEAEEDNYEIPNEITTDIVLGDLFEIGEHRLLCGDSTQVDTWQKVMNEKLCDMVMTDPPYNVDYSSKNKMLNYSDKGNRNQTDIENDKMDNNSFYQFLYDFYTALGSYTKQGGAYYVWFSEAEGINFRKALIDAGILLKQNLIWVKNNIVLGRQDYQNKHESCLYGWKEGAAHYFTNERTHTTVIEDKLDIKKLDPSLEIKRNGEILN